MIAALFNTAEISYIDHVSWFKSMMSEHDEKMYILMDGEVAVGHMRSSIKGDNAEISYSVSEGVRGNGFGKEIIRLGINKIREENLGIRRVTAKVKTRNMTSYLCFEKNGFKERYRQLEFDLS